MVPQSRASYTCCILLKSLKRTWASTSALHQWTWVSIVLAGQSHLNASLYLQHFHTFNSLLDADQNLHICCFLDVHFRFHQQRLRRSNHVWQYQFVVYKVHYHTKTIPRKLDFRKKCSTLAFPLTCQFLCTGILWREVRKYGEPVIHRFRQSVWNGSAPHFLFVRTWHLMMMVHKVFIPFKISWFFWVFLVLKLHRVAAALVIKMQVAPAPHTQHSV